MTVATTARLAISTRSVEAVEDALSLLDGLTHIDVHEDVDEFGHYVSAHVTIIGDTDTVSDMVHDALAAYDVSGDWAERPVRLKANPLSCIPQATPIL